MGSKKCAEKKAWKCDHGCPNTKTACDHLEKLITPTQKPSFEGTNRRVDKPIDSLYYSSGAGIILPEGIKSGRYEAQFRAKLAKTGISEIQIEVLTHIYVYEDTMKETAKELGIPTISTVVRLRTDALKQIRARGFK